MPGMDDIMRQNPELMQQFTQAAANSMSRENPGFGGFMSGVMGGQQNNRQQDMSVRPDMRTRPQSRQQSRPQSRPQPRQQSRQQSRPDVGMARGVAHFDDAINMEEKFEPVGRKEMKGPGDINDILAGLKTKHVNIQRRDNKSTISVDDLNEMNAGDLDVPKKSKRKPRSERNTISLNL